MPKPIAVVTGATGFIGSHLLPALLGGGWAVRAVGRRPRPVWAAPEVDYRVLDLAGAGESDRAELAEVVRDASHVFHLAGASSSLSSAEEMHRSNVVATQALVAAMLATGGAGGGSGAGGGGARLIHMSSTSIYGEDEQLPLPVREDVEPNPSRGYGKAKWAAEQAVWAGGSSAGGLETVIIRPVSVFGPGNIKLLASAILDTAIEAHAGRRRLAVPLVPVEQRLVHIDDLVAATIHLATHAGAAGRAFNLVFPEYPTSHRIAGILSEAFDLTVELSEDSDCGLSYEQRAAERDLMVAAGMRTDILLTEERFRFMRKANRNNRLSGDALTSTGFSFTFRDLEEPIRQTIGWYRNHDWVR